MATLRASGRRSPRRRCPAPRDQRARRPSPRRRRRRSRPAVTRWRATAPVAAAASARRVARRATGTCAAGRPDRSPAATSATVSHTWLVVPQERRSASTVDVAVGHDAGGDGEPAAHAQWIHGWTASTRRTLTATCMVTPTSGTRTGDRRSRRSTAAVGRACNDRGRSRCAGYRRDQARYGSAGRVRRGWVRGRGRRCARNTASTASIVTGSCPSTPAS